MTTPASASAPAPGPTGATSPVNPFPGLRPFEEDEADLFFGRQPQIRELLGTLRRVRFLAVLGSSGCGKSSLVRAGVIAALRAGFMVDDAPPWSIAIMRPGDNPIGALAAALQPVADPHADAEAARISQALLLATLKRGALGIVDAVSRSALPPGGRLFLLVDQFEELFRFVNRGQARAREEARAFSKLLIAAAAQRDVPIYVAITMRSEFLGDCSDLPGMPDAINQGLYLVPQMDRDSLREAIVYPIEAFNKTISPGLVDRLLNDLGGVAREDGRYDLVMQRDQLPLLQHAMMRLWNVPDGRELDLTRYHEIGGLDGALDRHLEEVYRELTPPQQAIAEAVFRALTEMTEDKQTVRRPTRVEELCRKAGVDQATLTDVLNCFRLEGRSFLLPGPDVQLTPDMVIDISHESLIRQWKRLAGWTASEALATKTAKGLRRSAHDWAENQREPSWLFSGARLAEAEQWLKLHAAEADPLEQEFVSAGLALRRSQEVQQQEHTELPRVITESAVKRADAIHKGVATCYISHATADSAFAQHLRKLFTEKGYSVLDAGELLGGAEWTKAIHAMIEASDSVIIVISPAQASSTWCRAEIDWALQSGKRLVPVLYRNVDISAVHPALAPLHWLDCTSSPLGDSLPKELHEAVDADITWVAAHSRFLVRASEWEARKRDQSLLLRGKDLRDAEEWLSQNREGRHPVVTPGQTSYILASRNSSQVNIRRALFAAIVLIMVLGLLAVNLVRQTRRAAEETRNAKLAADNAAHQQQVAEEALAREKAEKAASVRRQDATVGLAKVNAALRPNIIRPLPPPTNPGQTRPPTNAYAPRRAGQVLYFSKDDGGKVDLLIEAALREQGFTVERRPPSGATDTNALWFGTQVPLDDAKAAALALIRAGVDLKYIGRFANSQGKEQIIQIGGRPKAKDDPPLKVDFIVAQTDFPARP